MSPKTEVSKRAVGGERGGCRNHRLVWEEGAFVQKTKQGGRATISKPRKNKNLEEKTYLWCTTRFYREPYLYSSLIQ